MARKGNQQKNGFNRCSLNHQKGDPASGPATPNIEGEDTLREMKTASMGELSNGSRESINDNSHMRKKNKHRSGKSLRREKQGLNATNVEDQPVSTGSNLDDFNNNASTIEACTSANGQEMFPDGSQNPEKGEGRETNLGNGPQGDSEWGDVEFSETVVFRYLRTRALSISKTFAELLERHKPSFIYMTTKILIARDYVRMKIEHASPIVLRWIIIFKNIMMLLAMVWLDCTLRGIHSFIRMGTTSFFSVVWCSVLSVIASVGMVKFVFALAIAAAVGIFIGFTIALLFVAILGVLFLWFYGSFWTTALVILFGGLAFILSRERLALFIATLYSVYCAWYYVGWLGLVLGLNLSFLSSDALIFFLKNHMNEQQRTNGPSEQADGMRGQPPFCDEPGYAPSAGTSEGLPADRTSGVPSTSGSDSEITSEDEVIRLLNCTDHYSALGLSRFQTIDVSLLKREYRKKAMLVHPDKNMGNEKAAEAFKKLQNAYEVLLDSFKRKAYDDELKRDELINYFRSFQHTSQQNKRNGLFSSNGVARADVDGEDVLLESRRIACKKCGNFHLWIYTKKSKSKARWCQECKDYHPAKDGDGWVEQSSQPFLFGILQKVEAPSVYVCASSKIYDATEWYICQGMRCAVNTHKPSFHVNTNMNSKHNNGKGASPGQRGGIPAPNMEETMTEEEFFEWLQNAVQAGMFDNFAGNAPESPSAQNGSTSKSPGSNSGGGGSKRKKKGKKQW